jgi:hypothetical protein
MSSERQRNQAAFRHLKDLIHRTYPPDRYVAIAGAVIVADAASFDELDASLKKLGHDSPDVLVVQAGVEYPESAVIYI